MIVILLKDMILDWSEILLQEWRMNDLSGGGGNVNILALLSEKKIVFTYLFIYF